MPEWTIWIIIAGAVLAAILLKRLAFVSPAKARELLKAGAMVIDVRSREEFQERHLPGVLNIPLDQLAADIARTAPDKDKPLLLHCQSGGRSGLAKAGLKRLGYSNVSNLGSYARARTILAQ